MARVDPVAAEPPIVAERLLRREPGLDPHHLGRLLLTAHVGTVEARQPAVVVVQDRHDLQRVSLAAVDHPPEQRERERGLAGIDRVGEVPGRDTACFTQERLDLGDPDPHTFAVRRPQHPDQTLESPRFLAELLGDAGCGCGVEAQPVLLRFDLDPRLAILRTIRRTGVDDMAAAGLHRIGELLGHPTTAADEHELGRVERVAEILEHRRRGRPR